MSGVLWHLETLIYNLLYSQWHCFSYHFCILSKQSNINCNDQANNLTYELPLSFFFLHNNTQPWSSFSWASGYPLSRYIYQITLHFWHTFKQFSDNLGIVVWHITGKANSPNMHMAFCFFLSLDTCLHLVVLLFFSLFLHFSPTGATSASIVCWDPLTTSLPRLQIPNCIFHRGGQWSIIFFTMNPWFLFFQIKSTLLSRGHHTSVEKTSLWMVSLHLYIIQEI